MRSKMFALVAALVLVAGAAAVAPSASAQVAFRGSFPLPHGVISVGVGNPYYYAPSYSYAYGSDYCAPGYSTYYTPSYYPAYYPRYYARPYYRPHRYYRTYSYRGDRPSRHTTTRYHRW